ncbi:MAG TPA: LLM class flavin-dependent oxidoreductase [Solirubrobacteraceae bacterium]|nr:LLM class flavin-dependent oxidoreductase [Solirubrobacteraceae bacterium]
MTARRGIFVSPFDELADPRIVAELAQRAEAAGWEGFFLWDHVNYAPPVRALADVWVTLAAVAVVTQSVRIGPLVTPLSRRRPQKLARETVTLDQLSGGRLTLGVGLGVLDNGELEPFGEELDPRRRAELLDEGLDRLAAFWSGEFQPPPHQSPRIPVWVAGRYHSRRRPLARAVRWDGFFPIEVPSPDALARLAEEVHQGRVDAGHDAPFDLVAEIAPGADAGPWEAAGATWVLTSFEAGPKRRAVEAAIDLGPAG